MLEPGPVWDLLVMFWEFQKQMDDPFPPHTVNPNSSERWSVIPTMVFQIILADSLLSQRIGSHRIGSNKQTELLKQSFRSCSYVNRPSLRRSGCDAWFSWNIPSCMLPASLVVWTLSDPTLHILGPERPRDQHSSGWPFSNRRGTVDGGAKTPKNGAYKTWFQNRPTSAYLLV